MCDTIPHPGKGEHYLDVKICSLLPSGTEILFALGLGNQITGVSDLCDYPPAARSKPVVSRSKIDVSVLSSDEVERELNRILADGESPYELDQEWLLTHPPDVVLTQNLCHFCEVDSTTVGQAVQGLAYQPKVVVLQPKTLPGIFETISEVGEVCNAGKAAAVLVDGLKKRVRIVEGALDSVEYRPRVFSLEGINPIVIGGHWIPDLLERAGGVRGPYLPGSPACRLDWKEVLNYAPEKLFIDLCSSDLGRGLREVPWLAAQNGWMDIPAVQTGEVYLIDHVYFSCPGPRVVNGLELLAQLTHPHIFSERIPPDTVVKLNPVEAKNCSPDEIASCFHPFP